MRFCPPMRYLLLAALTVVVPVAAHAGERITLSNGFSVICDHRQMLDAEHVRLFLDRESLNYVDISASSIALTEPGVALPLRAPIVPGERLALPAGTSLSVQVPLDALIRDAGEARSINVELLHAVVNAESGGRVRVTSRAGAQGLMQLMPSTARSMGVQDSFEPRENLRGGTDYLDALLRRYHDDLPLALAAYNAGPGAVDRYHGVPPYRETRLYVARIIREFNRRTLLAQGGHATPTHPQGHEDVAAR